MWVQKDRSLLQSCCLNLFDVFCLVEGKISREKALAETSVADIFPDVCCGGVSASWPCRGLAKVTKKSLSQGGHV